jgi:cation/acetate symporter
MLDVQAWTYIIVGLTFTLYIAIAVWSRANSTKEFYIAGGGVSPLCNGLATAADWMSAASFISMAGLISFDGLDGARYLMGWTGGYVLLALLFAPYLRKFGKFTVPDFIGDRYYSNNARIVALICAIFVSFTYVVGQMGGVGLVFSRFLGVSANTGIIIGMTIVFAYAMFGGMKGITYTQVAQYCVLIFAFMVPAIFISLMMTGNPIPLLGFGSELVDGSGYLLDRLDGLSEDLGFATYTDGSKSTIDMFFITAALMFGTAGLPHVIIRFFTVPSVKAARKSAFYALFFIVILYTAAPAVAAFARTNLINSVSNVAYVDLPNWFKAWENAGLIAWIDKNDDGKVQYLGKAKNGGKAITTGKPVAQMIGGKPARGKHGQILIAPDTVDTTNVNELEVNRDIMVLANPEIAKLPNWVIALVAAGGLAAALSTAAGLLLVISTSISHDLLKRTLMPDISEKKELLFARASIFVAILLAGYSTTLNLGFVGQVVAFAFGLAASSFFPAIILGIFSKRMNREGAVAGMVIGIIFTATYIIYFKFVNPDNNNADHWFMGISPEGIGTVGMMLNLSVSLIISRITPAPPESVQDIVASIRIPRGSGSATHH